MHESTSQLVNCSVRRRRTIAVTTTAAKRYGLGIAGRWQFELYAAFDDGRTPTPCNAMYHSKILLGHTEQPPAGLLYMRACVCVYVYMYTRLSCTRRRTNVHIHIYLYFTENARLRKVFAVWVDGSGVCAFSVCLCIRACANGRLCTCRGHSKASKRS